jgi:hypothetical protein
MKLQQGQLWKTTDTILRLVKLERLAVEYKAIPAAGPGVEPGEGTHHRVTKKEFCRLIKGATMTLPTT